MANLTPSELRGFLMPLALTSDNLWAAQATYSQQSKQAGSAAAADPSALSITTTGAQDNADDITITTNRGGTPGDARGATFTWRPTAASGEYGHDNGGTVTAFEAIKWGYSGVSFQDPDCLVLTDGTLVIAHQWNDGLNQKLQVLTRSAALNSTFTAVTVRNRVAGSFGVNYKPALCQLPTGDLLLFSWNDLGGDAGQLAVHYSTDSGASWILMNGAALDSNISIHSSTGYTLGRLRAAGNNDQVLLVARLVDNNTGASFREHIGQFASSNMGASWSTVAVSSNELLMPDCFVDQNGKFRIAVIKTANSIAIYTMPHAFFDLDSLGLYATQTYIITGGPVIATITSKVLADGSLSVWQDPDGTIYSCQKSVANDLWFMAASRDNGASWSFFQKYASTSSSPYPIVDFDNSTTSIENPAGASWKGIQFLAHNHKSNGTTLDNSLSAIYLGGYSTRTIPGLNEYATTFEYVGYSKSWLPFDLPQNTGIFTSSGAGVTESIDAGYLKLLDTGGGGSITYEATPTSTKEQGLIVSSRVSAIQTSGSDRRGIRLRLANGTYNYDLTLRILDDSLILWDNSAGSQLANASPDTTTNSLSILMFFYGAKIFVYFQDDEGATPGASRPKDLRNYSVMTSTTVTNAGAGTSGNLIQFGHLSVPAATLESYFHSVLFVAGADTGQALTETDYSNVNAIAGRPYPTLGFYAYVDGSMSISTRDGPAFKEESYRIQVTAQYPINNLFFASSPSPRVQWRSDAVANPVTTNIAEQLIPLQLDTSIGATAESRIGNDLIALHLAGCNFRTSTIERYDLGSTSWISVGSIDASAGLSNSFIRKGSTIEYGGAGATNFYLFNNESIGWRALLDDGAGNEIWREIEWNTEGLFGTPSTGKQAIIKLVGSENTDPTSGTVYLCPPDVTAVVSTLGETGTAWALRIPAQKTLEGDARIGLLSFGSVIVQAPQYGRGRSIAWNPNVQLFEQADNVVRPSARSKGRRSISLSWSEGVDMRNFYSSTLATMDYWLSSASAGAEPVANVGDVPYQLQGLYRYLQNGSHPTVYIPKISYAASPADNTQILNRKQEHLLALPEGEITIDSVLGDELDDEVMRVSTIQLVEII